MCWLLLLVNGEFCIHLSFGSISNFSMCPIQSICFLLLLAISSKRMHSENIGWIPSMSDDPWQVTEFWPNFSFLRIRRRAANHCIKKKVFTTRASISARTPHSLKGLYGTIIQPNSDQTVFFFQNYSCSEHCLTTLWTVIHHTTRLPSPHMFVASLWLGSLLHRGKLRTPSQSVQDWCVCFSPWWMCASNNCRI
jgi:hypothetical protein